MKKLPFSMTNRKLNLLAPGVSSDDFVIVSLVLKNLVYLSIVKITLISNLSVKIALPLHLCLLIFKKLQCKNCL